MEQLTILADDRVGLLADISDVLGRSGINIDAISAEVSEGKAVIVLGTSDMMRTRELLQERRFIPTSLKPIPRKPSTSALQILARDESRHGTEGVS